MRCKPVGINHRILPDKGQQGGIGQAGFAEKPKAKAGVQIGQERDRTCAVGGQRLGRAAGVFDAIERSLETAVTARDPCRSLGRHLQPAFGVVLCKRPLHDLQAFRDHALIGDQHRHGGFGRGR